MTETYKRYEQGIADAWSLARELLSMTPVDREKCFNCIDLNTNHGIGILKYLNYYEVQDKIIKYKQQKELFNNFKVGDEVYTNDKESPRVIVGFLMEYGQEPKARQLISSGKCIVDEIRYLHKTGRHFKQVEEIFSLLNMEVK